MRAGGILLHPTSLPGPYGIGDLGPEAYAFVDWMKASGCKLWQILPLGPTGYRNSPYQCHSVFAGNAYLVSPDLLAQDGLLTRADLVNPRAPGRRAPAAIARVDYASVIPWKKGLLDRAYARFAAGGFDELSRDFASYCADNSYWLEDFALFMALKESAGGGSWLEWPTPLRLREPQALDNARKSQVAESKRFAFFQFLFSRQWSALRRHAAASGIQIIGDIPIFASEDSADVWSHPELFCLDRLGVPTTVTGVPPDYFSPTGQLWGNPMYRWQAHKADGYAWWLERFRTTLRLVDIARLDHFRGFVASWEIPYGSPTAETGHWTDGPADEFFEALGPRLAVPSKNGLPLIAEDLGDITPEVVRLRERFGLPGMRVLQFGFSDPTNPFLPHNYTQNCVAYTGTHDNGTSRAWLASATRQEAAFALRYVQGTARNFAWQMIRAIWSSVAEIAVAPMQDVLNLGTRARMNFPGRAGGNWEWRMQEGDLAADLGKRLLELNSLYGREPTSV